ncbi:MAG: efflux RND transporter permease subunit, partial [Acidobacteriaceae bacterium]
ILAAVIIVLFLRDWTSSLIAGLVIPVTIAVTFIVLWAIGQSFNLMTLGGLAAAVGLVIDDAIVVVENIALHREAAGSPTSPVLARWGAEAGENRIEAVRKALAEITQPLIGSTITPIVVFLPLISVTGVTGTFFRALALTMTVALLTSLALALTWTPALSLTLFRGSRKSAHIIPIDATPEPDRQHRLMAPILRAHERLLRAALTRPVWLAAVCGLLIVTVFVAYRALGSDLLPEMDEGAFVLDYIMPAGSSLQETNRVLLHVDHILHQLPEVTTTSRRTGLQMGLAAVTEANTGDFTVLLSDHRSRGIDEIMADARQRIRAAEPELDVEFTQVLQDMIGDLSNAPEPVQIKLFSTNQDLLNQLAPRVGDAISKLPGVVDVENGIDNTISGPATSFEVDPGIAARYGFTTSEIATDATSILDGLPTPQPLIQNGRPYTVRVRLDDAHRASLDAIENTVFLSSTGKMATLGALAHIEQLPPQNEILRENLQQLVTVTGRLEGSDLGSAIARVQKAIADLHLPSSVRVQYGGTWQEQQQSFHELLQVLLLALVLVYGVLLAEFRNFSAPIAVLVSSVLSTGGVIFALLITGTTFNVASFMGLIMVIGIVAKNGILLLDADQRFRAAGMSAREAMIQAARRRLRPIVMTALAAITGMLPLALALGSGSQVLQPLAIAVIGGLLISMALSLIVTPAVYYYLARE